ncbi:TetR/AcrR family transcriptional regulator [Haloechinothrix sp. LS1_15]|uniref:TetR/AcrR family transcriptional regulator n=1 Tax=Haloechinothrix sp. LS1_15 TaxID=2652248 RepID=UPI002947427D|nr:TetR/AcrR family transcriptional regulator [Haloechinothrix sp. LS1_15]MDV6013782.1 TetR/AcrR family transcriptional regulator [Haloechinothrix sp. LS1_15]
MFDNQPTAQERTRPAVVQRRRVERVQAILDAAEELLGEQGYEAATLKAVGERAGIPTASVYHYFAHRHKVEAELLQRHLRALDERVTAALDSPTVRTLRDAVDATIDPMLAYFRQYPSCAELWFAGRHETLTELVQAFDESTAQRLWRLLVERELLRADTPQFAVQLAFEAGSRLFDVAFRRSPAGDETTMNEARRLVTAYLETYA